MTDQEIKVGQKRGFEETNIKKTDKTSEPESKGKKRAKTSEDNRNSSTNRTD